MEMKFSMRDMYPSMGLAETSTEVVPEADDQEVLVENAEEAEKASKTTARGKNIILAVGVLISLVVFFGGGK